MRRTSVIAVLVAAVALAGAGGATASHSAPVGPKGLPTSQEPFDLQFIDMLASHHMMAIEMSKIALRRATHPEVRQLAAKSIKSQREDLRKLSTFRRTWYGDGEFQPVQPSLMMMRMMGQGPNMLDALRRTTRFDYAFLSAFIAHHGGAITMSRWETQAGEHAALRALAAKDIRMQARDIGDMIRWRMQWYGK